MTASASKYMHFDRDGSIRDTYGAGSCLPISGSTVQSEMESI
jgi:hypothetical protein